MTHPHNSPTTTTIWKKKKKKKKKKEEKKGENLGVFIRLVFYKYLKPKEEL